MGELRQILKLRAVLLWRWLMEHAFVLFVLAPVPLGGALWIASRYLPLLRQDLAPLLFGGGGLMLAVVATAALLPGALSELFPRRSSADQLLDILPISEALRLHGALAGMMVRALPIALLLSAGCYWLGDSPPGRLVGWAGWLVLVLWSLVPGVLLLALGLGVWRQARASYRRWLLLSALAASWLLWVLDRGVAGTLLASPWLPAAKMIERVFGEVLGEAQPPVALWPLALVAAASYLLCRLLIGTWRRSVLDSARWGAKADFGSRLARVATAFLPAPLRVQVRRDLLQVLRRFSPAVGLAVSGSALLLLAAGAALSQAALEPYLRGRLALLAAAAAVLPISGLAPLLLARQQPRFWIERASGVERQLVWRAKLWSARLLALPAVLGGAALVLASQAAAGWQLALVVGELVVIAWMLSSILGVAGFETAEQPSVGLVFGGLLGLAVASFLIFYRPFWILGVAGYFYVFNMLGERATLRVWFMEAER